MSEVDWKLPEAPDQIRTIGLLHLAAGVLNLLTAAAILLGAFVQGLLTFGLGCLCGFPALFLGPLGVVELYSAWRHLGTDHAGLSAPRGLAIAELIAAAFGGLIPAVLGGVSLYLLSDKDVEAYYYRVSKAVLTKK